MKITKYYFMFYSIIGGIGDMIDIPQDSIKIIAINNKLSAYAIINKLVVVKQASFHHHPNREISLTCRVHLQEY